MASHTGSARAPRPRDPADIHLGARVRRLRRACRVSQDALAQALGLSFQQVQKYEVGANRISASTLLAIGARLRVPAAYFFAGLPGQPVDLQSPGEGPTEPPGAPAAFWDLSAERRRLVEALVQALAVPITARAEDAQAPGR